MTTYYLVKDQNGKFYVRRYILGIPCGVLSKYSDYWWSGPQAQDYSAHDTESEAEARFKWYKVGSTGMTFTKLRKLT